MTVHVCIVNILFGGSEQDRQTAKFNSPPNFLAIQFAQSLCPSITVTQHIRTYGWMQTILIVDSICKAANSLSYTCNHLV